MDRGLAPRGVSSDLVCIDPPIQVGTIKMHPPAPAYDDELSLANQMLNGLFSTSNIICGFFHCEQSCGDPSFPQDPPILDRTRTAIRAASRSTMSSRS